MPPELKSGRFAIEIFSRQVRDTRAGGNEDVERANKVHIAAIGLWSSNIDKVSSSGELQEQGVVSRGCPRST